MRWKAYVPPNLGDSRVIERFLYLPKTIQGETRWLETAWIDQVYCEVMVNRGKFNQPEAQWKDRTWETNPDADTPEVLGGHRGRIKIAK